MNRILLVFIVLSIIIVVAVFFGSIKNVGVGTQNHGTFSLIIPILNLENPQSDIDQLKPFLRSGDILVFPISQYSNVRPIKSEVIGLSLATGGTSISSLVSGITNIPSDIDYVTYDYEKGHTPEWTRDQAISISYFDQLHSLVDVSGKKLIITPAWVWNPNFDWGEIAKHTDVLLVQVQNFQTNADVPNEIKPSTLGINLSQVTKLIVSEVRLKSPSTKIYLQFGFDVTDNPDNIINDINTVKNSGIDGVALWYNAGTSSATSKLPLEIELLKKYR